MFYLSSSSTVSSVMDGVMPGSSWTERIIVSIIFHILEYAILSILLYIALNNSGNDTLRKNAVYLAIGISVLFGVTDEIHQYFIPGRYANSLDLISNAIGSIVVLIKRKRR
jgi:VanZ family protein